MPTSCRACLPRFTHDRHAYHPGSSEVDLPLNALHSVVSIPLKVPSMDLLLQLPKRLARRLMDLQFLPYIVVTNPYIKRVYNAYHHAFNTLRQMPEAS